MTFVAILRPDKGGVLDSLRCYRLLQLIFSPT